MANLKVKEEHKDKRLGGWLTPLGEMQPHQLEEIKIMYGDSWFVKTSKKSE
ncbi:MAG: hypothetical protein GOVbin7581_38 [Prokaryotic dsDNA virus sp.]|nr:MAG: hypothetical protein GOVbin7581_38 [Prokaryotic dsDNA virus sp.]|tara:strand:+ start:17125 stop:17277 length:153 start_codon:yes stop_codon:yes gene_type:complete